MAAGCVAVDGTHWQQCWLGHAFASEAFWLRHLAGGLPKAQHVALQAMYCSGAHLV